MNSIQGAALSCGDGKPQEAVERYMREYYNIRYVDGPTLAGAVKYYSSWGSLTKEVEQFLHDQLLIYLNAHHSPILLIAAHEFCAGNPVSKAEQLEQLKKSVFNIANHWNDLPINAIIGVYCSPIDKGHIGERWEAEEIIRIDLEYAAGS